MSEGDAALIELHSETETVETVKINSRSTHVLNEKEAQHPKSKTVVISITEARGEDDTRYLTTIIALHMVQKWQKGIRKFRCRAAALRGQQNIEMPQARSRIGEGKQIYYDCGASRFFV